MTSFRHSKKCPNCNADTSTPPINLDFAFSVSPTLEKTQAKAAASEKLAGTKAEKQQAVGTLEYPGSHEDVKTSGSDFDLDLSDLDTPVHTQTATIPESVAKTTGQQPVPSQEILEENEIEIDDNELVPGVDDEEETKPSLALDLGTVPDLEIGENEFTVEVEDEPEEKPSLFLDLGSSPELEIDAPAFAVGMDEESETKSTLLLDLSGSPDLEIEQPMHLEPETGESEGPALTLDFKEPEPPVETKTDPLMEIESLDLTLDIEELPPQPPAKVPESTLDGIKLELEIEEHPELELELEIEHEPEKDSSSPPKKPE